MAATFIERDFPVEKLNLVALGEGNSKKPIYRMHKWWARRLGSVFRAIVLSVFNEAKTGETELWRQFTEGADLDGKIVLDPFMGGGTTVVEALRMGCKVIGVDINPVAWFVTKEEVEAVDFDALDTAFRDLEQTVGKRIKEYYRTTCPNGHDSDVMYYFWVKTAECIACGNKIRLFPHFELSRRDSVNISVCPDCLQVVETPGYSPNTTCPDCKKIFDPHKGVSGRGMFRCPQCNKEQKVLNAVERKGTALDMELHALEGYCGTCGRFFKRIDDNDKRQWEWAKTEFEARKETLLFPREAIPTEGRSDPRPVNHGYRYFWQMFNERQLLSLSILLEQILKIPDQNIRELMLTAFSDCLNTNNMFCKYEVEWHKVSLFFSLHAFHPIERPAENNVWGTTYGRGSFIKCFRKVHNAKEYSQAPYERLLDLRGQRYTKRTGKEKIEGQLVADFEQLQHTDHAALLRCQSSNDLSFIPDKSVDAVITDPPYFDNIQYSELADFFYVWLRLGLIDAYPWFRPELSSRPNEIVKNDKLGKTTSFFNEGLKRVFQECHRVLKDDGLLVFTFHHTKTWAWEGIGQLVLDAGFYVSATPIVRSEGRGEVHSSEGNIRYDCIFVCRKRPNPLAQNAQSQLKERILTDVTIWTQRTLESRMPVNEIDVFAIMMGKTIEHCTKLIAAQEHNQNTVNLAETIDEMAKMNNYVGTGFSVTQSELSSICAEKVQQLALFVMESKAKYG